ncbi:MAG: hypothetical protein CMJ44_12200 [Pimelobacter sp.]|nr:hypothetical protein [Pimelobacter sp.]
MAARRQGSHQPAGGGRSRPGGRPGGRRRRRARPLGLQRGPGRHRSPLGRTEPGRRRGAGAEQRRDRRPDRRLPDLAPAHPA